MHTLDFPSPYTNIPHEEGISAIYQTLKDYNYNDSVSTESVRNLLRAMLEMNNFQFNGKDRHGERSHPSLANLFMGMPEKYFLKYLKKLKLKRELNKNKFQRCVDFPNKYHKNIHTKNSQPKNHQGCVYSKKMQMLSTTLVKYKSHNR